jgi:hypothetical protein
LSRRNLKIPAENLARWRIWQERFDKLLGKDHPDTLVTRDNVAFWTGNAGDAQEALRLFRERERLLGKDHPDTLVTRNNVASWTGRAGAPKRHCAAECRAGGLFAERKTTNV